MHLHRSVGVAIFAAASMLIVGCHAAIIFDTTIPITGQYGRTIAGVDGIALLETTAPGQVLNFTVMDDGGNNNAISAYASIGYSIGTAAKRDRFPCIVTTPPAGPPVPALSLECTINVYGYPYGPSETPYFLWGTANGLSHSMQIAFPAPILTASTIRANFSQSTAEPLPPYEFPVGQSNATLLYINGANFLPNASIVTVTYGLLAEGGALPLMWTGRVDESLTTDKVLAFWTQAGAYGRALIVYVNANGRNNTAGLTLITANMVYYSQEATLVKVEGCTPGYEVERNKFDYNGTRDCPTRGEVVMKVYGTGLYYPLSVNINGAAECVNLAGKSQTTPYPFPCPGTVPGTCVTCRLPPGTGLKTSLSLSIQPDSRNTRGFADTKLVNLLGYAAPKVISITSGCVPNIYDEFGYVTGIKDCTRSGGDRVFINGTNFGASGAKILVGGSLGLSVTHGPGDVHSHLSFTVPAGSGAARSVILLQSGGTLNADQISLSYFQCPPGTYQTGLGGLNCTECAVGLYNALADQFQCLPCSSGYYTGSATGVSVCSACEPGSARSGFPVDQPLCDICQAGQEQQGRGQALCVDCAPGKYAAQPNTTRCTDCPRGKASREAKSTSCSDCTGIRFQNSEGQTSCQSCLAGQYYDGFTCNVCPAGAICDGPDGILTEDDYYVYYTVPDIIPGIPLYDAQQNRIELQSVPCLPQYCVACPANTTGLNSTTLVTGAGSGANGGQGANNRAVLEGLKPGLVFSCCSDNRPEAQVNALCGVCNSGFTIYGNVCVPCSETDGGIVLLLILMQWLYVTVFHWFAQIDNADLRIFLNFIQFVFLFLAAQASNLTAWLSLFNFNILTSVSTTCVAPLTDMQSLASGIYVPIFGFALLALNIVIHYIVWRFFRKGYCAYKMCVDQKYESRNPFTNMIREQLVMLRETDSFLHVWNMYRRTFLGFLANSYTSVSQSIFTFFSCIKVKGDAFVQSYPSISCYHDPEYLRLYPLFIVLTLVLCLIPVLLGIRLWLLNRDGLLFGRKDIRLIYGSVIESYAPSKYAWECWVLIRRIVLCSIALDTFQDDLPQKFTYLCMCNILFLGVHYLARPYLLSMDNYAESLSLITLTLMTLFLISAPAPLPASYAIGLTAMSFTVAAAFAIRILFTRYEVLYRAKKEADRKRKEKELNLDAPKVDLANDEDFYAAEAEAEAAAEGVPGGLPSPANSEATGNSPIGDEKSPPGSGSGDEKGVELATITPVVAGAGAGAPAGGDLKNDEDFYASEAGGGGAAPAPAATAAPIVVVAVDPAPAPAASTDVAVTVAPAAGGDAAAAAPAPAAAGGLQNDDDFYANN